jgi:hypothetical protein
MTPHSTSSHHSNQPLNLGGFFDSFVRQIDAVINGR